MDIRDIKKEVEERKRLREVKKQTILESFQPTKINNDVNINFLIENKDDSVYSLFDNKNIKVVNNDVFFKITDLDKIDLTISDKIELTPETYIVLKDDEIKSLKKDDSLDGIYILTVYDKTLNFYLNNVLFKYYKQTKTIGIDLTNNENEFLITFLNKVINHLEIITGFENRKNFFVTKNSKKFLMTRLMVSKTIIISEIKFNNIQINNVNDMVGGGYGDIHFSFDGFSVYDLKYKPQLTIKMMELKQVINGNVCLNSLFK